MPSDSKCKTCDNRPIPTDEQVASEFVKQLIGKARLICDVHIAEGAFYVVSPETAQRICDAAQSQGVACKIYDLKKED